MWQTNCVKTMRALSSSSCAAVFRFSVRALHQSNPSLRSLTRCVSSARTLGLFPQTRFNFSPNVGSRLCVVFLRSLCSLPSPRMFDVDEPVSCSEVLDGGGGGLAEEDAKVSIPVRAFFISTSIDLRGLTDQNKSNCIGSLLRRDDKANFMPLWSRMTNYVVLRFGDAKSNSLDVDGGLSESNCSYMVVFQYGSVVLFNILDHEVDGYLKIVERHASGLLPETRKDEYEVRENPALQTWMQGGLDYIMLQYLNIDGIRTIGSVLGQSIALDYYACQVDGMVAEFTDINLRMEKTGTFNMEKKKLFQLAGKANSNLADVILKLGFFERFDIAWKDANYAQIWEYLRDEFELTQRFTTLDFKLKFVEDNIKFLQETLHNRKSNSLEWIIIILIGAEIAISVYDIAHKSL
ncbi:hypothetical protein Sjap_001630 [Stephania japonica]|uniref:DUF155 domain-containing protein n=1 Tax=Stephania japonica TaxID=461633 RepID=A0AAP0PTG4_9MAGN